MPLGVAWFCFCSYTAHWHHMEPPADQSLEPTVAVVERKTFAQFVERQTELNRLEVTQMGAEIALKKMEVACLEERMKLKRMEVEQLKRETELKRRDLDPCQEEKKQEKKPWSRTLQKHPSYVDGATFVMVRI